MDKKVNFQRKVADEHLREVLRAYKKDKLTEDQVVSKFTKTALYITHSLLYEQQKDNKIRKDKINTRAD